MLNHFLSATWRQELVVRKRYSSLPRMVYILLQLLLNKLYNDLDELWKLKMLVIEFGHENGIELSLGVVVNSSGGVPSPAAS